MHGMHLELAWAEYCPVASADTPALEHSAATDPTNFDTMYTETLSHFSGKLKEDDAALTPTSIYFVFDFVNGLGIGLLSLILLLFV